MNVLGDGPPIGYSYSIPICLHFFRRGHYFSNSGCANLQVSSKFWLAVCKNFLISYLIGLWQLKLMTLALIMNTA